MQQYILRRLMLMVPSWLGVSIVIFTLMRVVPGDAAAMMVQAETGVIEDQENYEQMRHFLGLDRPIHEQYASWLWGAVRLDFGKSLWTKKPVIQEIATRLPVSLEITFLAITISLLVAIPIGVVSAMRQDTWVDYLFRFVSISGLALPNFWVGTLMILGLAIVFRWSPPPGFTPLWQDPLRNLSTLIWPSLALGFSLSAIVSRMTRSQMLEVLREDYIRTAWAKGMRERAVIFRHAFKNAILPVITITGTQTAFLLGGTVIMETIFVLPGMGRNLIDSITRRDYPMVQAIILFMATLFLFMNLLVDLLYARLDPRIRYK